MKKLCCIALALVLLPAPCSFHASANSAQTKWQGTNSMGAIIESSPSPVCITNEKLTLNIQEFPANYYASKEDYLAYGATATAEYTFYNPESYEVKATLAFPFGAQPDYANLYDETAEYYDFAADAAKYSVTADGEAISTRIRYTYSSGGSFNVNDELAKLSDKLLTDEFYTIDTQVTKYRYVIGGEDKASPIDEQYRAATVAFDWSSTDENSRIFLPECNNLHTLKNGSVRLGTGVQNSDEFFIYAIGNPLSAAPVLKIYENGNTADGTEIDGKAVLTKTENMNFYDFVLSFRPETATEITDNDWYNAVLCALQAGTDDRGFITAHIGENAYFAEGLQRWHEYELTFAPQQTLKNTITVPLYPSIRGDYSPTVFQYTYLLSPAATWADFGDLEIEIKTPYYLTQSSLLRFEETEDGYHLQLTGLPDSELDFTLCTVENPTPPKSNDQPQYLFAAIATVLAVGLLVGVVLLFLNKKDEK